MGYSILETQKERQLAHYPYITPYYSHEKPYFGEMFIRTSRMSGGTQG